MGLHSQRILAQAGFSGVFFAAKILRGELPRYRLPLPEFAANFYTHSAPCVCSTVLLEFPNHPQEFLNLPKPTIFIPSGSPCLCQTLSSTPTPPTPQRPWASTQTWAGDPLTSGLTATRTLQSSTAHSESWATPSPTRYQKIIILRHITSHLSTWLLWLRYETARTKV